ncbi:MAG: hypothetical protein ACK5Z2_17185 [Bacteroidota bacterium]|jgi:hypothetical protein
MISGKAILLWFLTISIFAISCTFSEQSKEAVREVKTKAFDSTFNISKLGLPIDTVEVTYMAYACDCPQHLTDSDQVHTKRVDKTQKGPHGYYIEATNTSIKIPDVLYYGGNRFRLYGYVRTSYGLPAEDIFITDHPPPGKVLCYFRWEIIEPYRSW